MKGGGEMSFPRLFIVVLMMVFVLGGSIQAVNFFKVEFGAEAVYAKDDNVLPQLEMECSAV
jgi:hypothetical protein